MFPQELHTVYRLLFQSFHAYRARLIVVLTNEFNKP